MKPFNLFILLFLGSVQTLFAQYFIFDQKDCQRSHCNWDFFELKETIEGEVLLHEFLPQNFSCRGASQNNLILNISENYSLYSFCPSKSCLSITILKINQDTIRIVSGNSEWYDKGAHLYITPEKIIPREERGSFNFIFHSLERSVEKKKRGWKKEYKKAQAELPSSFDQLVLKTTIGSLSDKSDYDRSVLDCEKELFRPISSNSFQCRWNFFEIQNPLGGKIIKYEAQTQPCHLIGYASLAIVAINNNQDTIRVLDYCNSTTFEEGAVIIIEAGESKSPISIPYTKTMEGGQEVYRSNEFDHLVFRTTYGRIRTKGD
jgi:hypothetical protein